LSENKNLVLKKFLSSIKKNKILLPGYKIIIGLSGGADSVAMFDLFFKLKINIIAAHVNHDLRGEESKRDENFVKSLCESKNILCEIKKINIKKIAHEKKISIEEAGRLVRYDFFNKLIKKHNANKIAIAHNKNDNAETILFKFFRGCGLTGLTGIKLIKNNIIRPLLDVTRDEIENYCEINNLKFITDSSNLDLYYARNLIRLKIMPEILKINKNLIYILDQNAKIICQEDNYLNQEADRLINKCVIIKSKMIEFNYKLISSNALIHRVCKRILEKNIKLKISFKHIDLIISLINKKNGAKIYLGNKFIAQKKFDKIIFKSFETQEINYEIKLDKKIYLKELNKNILISENEFLEIKNLCLKKSFCCDKDFVFKIRNYNPGDKIFFKSIGHKKIKKIFSERKIIYRESVLLLAQGANNIFWIFNNKTDIISDYEHGKKYFVYMF